MLDNLYRPVRGDRTKDRRLTQEYGANFKVNGKWMYGEIVKGWTKHEGIDYAGANKGDKIPVYASHNGTARVLNDKNGFGNYIVIDANGYSTYYAHLDSVSVKSGDWVRVCDPIGIMGSSGNSTAVHLHFGLKINGSWVDPTPYITNWNGSPVITPPTMDTSTFGDINTEDKLLLNNLVKDGIRSGEMGTLDKRVMVIIARIYSKTK